MSTQVSQDGIDEPKNDNGVRLSTFIENYRHVEDTLVTDHTVAIYVESKTSFYDSDAIIGAMVRKFGLEWEGETEDGVLKFQRDD